MKRTVTIVEIYEWDAKKKGWVEARKTVTTVDETPAPVTVHPVVYPPYPTRPYATWASTLTNRSATAI